MKIFFALLTFAIPALANQTVESDSTGALSGSYQECLSVSKFNHGTLNSVQLQISTWTSGRGGGLTGDIFVHAVVTGINQTLLDYSYSISTDADVWNVVSGINGNFDSDSGLPLAPFVGHGKIKFHVCVDVQDQFGVPETGETQVIVTYTH